MKETKKYWKGLEQLKNSAEFQEKANKEFPEYLPIADGEEPSRRDFLKLMGFGIAAVSFFRELCCESEHLSAPAFLFRPGARGAADVQPGAPAGGGGPPGRRL